MVNYLPHNKFEIYSFSRKGNNAFFHLEIVLRHEISTSHNNYIEITYYIFLKEKSIINLWLLEVRENDSLIFAFYISSIKSLCYIIWHVTRKMIQCKSLWMETFTNANDKQSFSLSCKNQILNMLLEGEKVA